MFWFQIDRDNWWPELAEILVGFKKSITLNPPTSCIFQTAMAMVIFDMRYIPFSRWSGSTPLHGCSLEIEILPDGIFEYVFKHILLCWLLFLHKKELSGRQPPQSNSSWPLSGSPWHTKYKGFLVMECAAVFPTWKLRLVYYMYFTAMEPCYTYRESKTRHYWSNWLPIYSVSCVSLDYQDTGLELILLKVLILMEAISDMHGSIFNLSYFLP